MEECRQFLHRWCSNRIEVAEALAAGPVLLMPQVAILAIIVECLIEDNFAAESSSDCIQLIIVVKTLRINFVQPSGAASTIIILEYIGRGSAAQWQDLARNNNTFAAADCLFQCLHHSHLHCP